MVYLYDQPAVRSQSVYHAVGYATGVDGPDTILVTTPAEPYVSIGYHQRAADELDLGTCAALGLPVVRREVGGGAVYLDSGQVFVNWVFRHDRLPPMLADRYARYAAVLVATYQGYGIPAELRPVNDIHVRGRKIGGTGAARLGEAELVVGSLMLDFDTETMAAVLRVSSVKMRDKVVGALRDYMTTMRRELGVEPDRDEVVDRYLAACSRFLGRPMVPGTLTAVELARARELDEVMSSPSWTHRTDGRRVAGVQIHAGVQVHATEYKAPAGLLRITTVVRDGVLAEVSIDGDVTVLPQDALTRLEAGLVGVGAGRGQILVAVEQWYDRTGVDAPGLPPAELVAAIVAALPAPG